MARIFAMIPTNSMDGLASKYPTPESWVYQVQFLAITADRTLCLVKIEGDLAGIQEFSIDVPARQIVTLLNMLDHLGEGWRLLSYPEERRWTSEQLNPYEYFLRGDERLTLRERLRERIGTFLNGN